MVVRSRYYIILILISIIYTKEIFSKNLNKYTAEFQAVSSAIFSYDNAQKTYNVPIQSRWTWVNPYLNDVIASPVLRLSMELPVELNDIKFGDKDTKVMTYDHKKGFKKLILDIPFNKIKNKISYYSKNKMGTLYIKNKNLRNNILIHKSCDKFGLGLFSNIAIYLRSNIAITCKDVQSDLKIIIQHSPHIELLIKKNLSHSLNQNDDITTFLVELDQLKFMENNILEKFAVIDKKTADTIIYSLTIADEYMYKEKLKAGLSLAYNSYLEFTSTSELSFNQFEFLVDLDYIKPLSKNKWVLLGNIDASIISVSSSNKEQKRASYFNGDLSSGYNLNHDSLNSTIFLMLGWSYLKMNASSEGWGVDQTMGPRFSFLFEKKKRHRNYWSTHGWYTKLLTKGTLTGTGSAEFGLMFSYQIDRNITKKVSSTYLNFGFINRYYNSASDNRKMRMNSLILSLMKEL